METKQKFTTKQVLVYFPSGKEYEVSNRAMKTHLEAHDKQQYESRIKFLEDSLSFERMK